MDWSALPPLSMLRAFEAAARLGGFSAAGRELNVTHAAIAQQVRGLEARLGAALMVREGRRVSLTAEGARLADGLGDGLGRIREAVAAFQQAREDGPARVTLTPAFSAGWLMPRIAGFREANPQAEVMFSPSTEVIDLPRSEFDLAIRFGTPPWPGVLSEPLVASRPVAVATPGLLAQHPIERPEDLLALPWIQETGSDEWRVWLASRGVEMPTGRAAKRDIMHLPGYMAVPALREGQGVGLTARVFVEADIAEGRLVSLFETSGHPNTGYHLLRRDAPLSPAATAFRHWLRAEASASGS